jgi:hypothetical protein
MPKKNSNRIKKERVKALTVNAPTRKKQREYLKIHKERNKKRSSLWG